MYFSLKLNFMLKDWRWKLVLKAREVHSVVATLELTLFNSSFDSCICGFLFMSHTVCHLGTLGNLLLLECGAPVAHPAELGLRARLLLRKGFRSEMTALVLCLSGDPG